MATNAQWCVLYRDAKTGRSGYLYLSSADLANAKAAHKRARDTAKLRLAKKGVKAVDMRSTCVG